MLCVCVCVCARACVPSCSLLLGGVELNVWLQSISGQNVIRTLKSWISVWAALLPHWGRVKSVIDKCDMLIWGVNRRKDSSVRTWRSTSWQPLQRGLPFQQQDEHRWSGKQEKGVMLWGAFVSEPLSWLSDHGAVWMQAILCGRLLS